MVVLAVLSLPMKLMVLFLLTVNNDVALWHNKIFVNWLNLGHEMTKVFINFFSYTLVYYYITIL